MVLEKILGYLDHKSLCRVQQVSKLWQQAVNAGHSWKNQLQHKVCLFCTFF